jgi:DNA (cytosine-5)-methyltransferase 3A
LLFYNGELVMAIKILLGGSPCTFWSIAQKNNRETEAEGLGWELFKNYLIAKEKFKPDFFLYENNKSAAQAIKDQIAEEFGVGVDPKVRFTYINSALVSAQNRQRFYVTNFGDIEQPEDRGIVLRDILENDSELISYELDANSISKYYESNGSRIGRIVSGDKNKEHDSQQYRVYNADGKSVTLCSSNGSLGKMTGLYAVQVKGAESDIQSNRVYSCDGKSVTLSANGGGQGGKTGLYACPYELSDEYYKGGKDSSLVGMTTNGEGKYRNGSQPSQQYRVYSCEGKSQVVNTLGNENYIVPSRRGQTPVYEVKDGQITIKDKLYPIKLKDGYYIIRKLTVRECARLQTMPDDYCKAVSDSQAYKALGNGWTAEIIIHLLNHALKDVPRDEEIIVLSMYDGIATGRYCLDKMGFTNVTYHAYEKDPYPIKIAMDNYPDIIQHGDAFAVREDDWQAPQTRSEWLDELLRGDL